MTADDWSRLWAPYDPSTYQEALAYLQPGERVLDIGAGDLRFARLAARHGCDVIAVEQQVGVLSQAFGSELPARLHVAIADARHLAFPPVDVAVLLMRHCADFGLYVQHLRQVGCSRLVTNARWGMGVEVVPLGPALPYDPERTGWQACMNCGRVSFQPGDILAGLPQDFDLDYVNVESCRQCDNSRSLAF